MIREEDRDGAVLKIFDTEQAQLLGVLGGDVSAVRSATGAGLCDTSFISSHGGREC